MRLALIVALAFILASCNGCSIYQAQNIEEWLTQAKQLDGSGCLYFRGNARPYADVSILAVQTYGKGAPKYIECLQSIPDAARMLTP